MNKVVIGVGSNIDPQNNIRKAIEFLAKHYPSFDYPEPEEVILLGKNKFRIKEVFTQMVERQGGKSSINGYESVYYMVKVLLAVFMVFIRRPQITGDEICEFK